MHHGWWMGGWMWLFWLLLAVLIIVLVRWAVARPRDLEQGHLFADETLKERYARGEMGREEYERTRADLRR